MPPTLLTYAGRVADVARRAPAIPAGLTEGQATPRDRDALAALYLAAYDDLEGTDIESARKEWDLTFAGEYGELWPEASPTLRSGDHLVANVSVVHIAPWRDTPACPFVIEVMVHPRFRRLGLARTLLVLAASELARHDQTLWALRVRPDNTAAIRLYEGLGFAEWDEATARRGSGPS